jgi:hypothetical protein
MASPSSRNIKDKSRFGSRLDSEDSEGWSYCTPAEHEFEVWMRGVVWHLKNHFCASLQLATCDAEHEILCC